MTAATTIQLTASTRLKRVFTRAATRLPERLMRTLAPPPVNADGEEMAPEIALMSGRAGVWSCTSTVADSWPAVGRQRTQR